MELAQDQSQVADNFTQLMFASADMPALKDPRGTHAADAQSKTGSNLAPPEMRLIEPSRPANSTLLQKRKIFHARGPRRVDDLVGVTQDVKDFIHLWNSFISKQRVEAGAKINWLCEAFLAEHGEDLVRTRELAMSWRLFMISVWYDGLIDEKTLNNCNLILENIGQTLLQKRKNFHARETRRVDDLVGVTQDEKDFMHLWNSFISKQRVEAGAKINWLCEAFVAEHGEDLVRTRELAMSWRLFMISRWHDGLIDEKTLNNCNMILENISQTLLQKRKNFHERGPWTLDDLVGLTQHEKDFMHLWNSFIDKQRVEEDVNVHEICKEFVTEHGKDLLQTPQLAWQWRSLMMLLWDDDLIDGNMFNEYLRIL